MDQMKLQEELYASFYAEAVPHMDVLYSGALRLTRSADQAEDLVQETMLKAFRYFSKYQTGTNCKAWLYKIMVNTFINRYRQQKSNREYLVHDEERPLQDRAPAPEANPFDEEIADEQQLYFKMFSDEVKAALEQVPEAYRMVVLLADLQDFAYKEIAEIMGCPIGTVMSRLYRGRRMLQARLVDYAQKQGVLSTQEEQGSEGEEGNIASLAAYRSKRKTG